MWSFQKGPALQVSIQKFVGDLSNEICRFILRHLSNVAIDQQKRRSLITRELFHYERCCCLTHLIDVNIDKSRDYRSVRSCSCAYSANSSGIQHVLIRLASLVLFKLVIIQITKYECLRKLITLVRTRVFSYPDVS